MASRLSHAHLPAPLRHRRPAIPGGPHRPRPAATAARRHIPPGRRRCRAVTPRGRRPALSPRCHPSAAPPRNAPFPLAVLKSRPRGTLGYWLERKEAGQGAAPIGGGGCQSARAGRQRRCGHGSWRCRRRGR